MEPCIRILTALVAGVLILQACAPIPIFREDPTLTPLPPLETPLVSTPTLLPATPIPTDKPVVAVEKNIVPGKPVTASRNLNTNLPKMAIDSKFDTWWGAGAFAPQWIEINLEGYYTITKIKLTPSQSPSGDTVHRILGRGVDGKYHILHTFEQFTQDGMQLQVTPEEPWTNVSSIRIETVSSPSWVSWREIMIFSREEPKALNDVPLLTPIPEGPKGVIAFYNNQFMGGIYLMRADGRGDAVLLAAHPTGDSKPSWSPDGTRIAFESLRDDPIDQKLMDIYVMNADGSHLARLTGNDGVYGHPDWSPDGTRILVSGLPIGNTNFDLFLLNPETGEITQLTDTPYDEIQPTWSPDGTQIAYTANKQGKNVWNLYILNVETGNIRQLTEGGGGDNQPDWSPNGESILFASNRSGDFEIYVMDVEGGDATRLTDTPGQDADPEWSPNGSAFVYSHREKKFGELFMMNADGSNRTLLYSVADKSSEQPVWSAKAVISNTPMIGSPFCTRDKNKDGQPDEDTNVFTTQDGTLFVTFPYRNMTTNQVFSIYWDFELVDQDFMSMVTPWKYGETGWLWSSDDKIDLSTISPQGLKIQISLGGEVVQEIECPIISQTLESTAVSTRTPTATRLPTLTPTITKTPTPKPTSTPVTYPPEGFHDGNKGTVDSASCSAFGWVVDPDDRKRDLRIQVLSDGSPVATTTANLLRSDVGACTAGTCGFNVSLWGVISSGEQHRITVQAYDEETGTWVDLSYTSKLLTCQGYPEGNHDGSEGLVDQAGCAAAGWVVDPDDRSEDVTVQVLSDGIVIAEAVASFHRPDLDKPNGCTGGTCGFRVDLWNLISHNDRHSIRVKALDAQTDTWHDLDYTPKTLTCGN